MFLLSCYIGKLYHYTHKVKAISTLAFLSLTLWIVFLKFCNIIHPSRPLANLMYVVWGLANGSLHVLIMTFSDWIFPEQFRFIIFAEIISENRLIAFIMANILSTFIRKTFDIKSLSMLYTIKVNFVYLSAVCLITSFMFFRQNVSIINYVHNPSKNKHLFI